MSFTEEQLVAQANADKAALKIYREAGLEPGTAMTALHFAKGDMIRKAEVERSQQRSK